MDTKRVSGEYEIFCATSFSVWPCVHSGGGSTDLSLGSHTSRGNTKRWQRYGRKHICGQGGGCSSGSLGRSYARTHCKSRKNRRGRGGGSCCCSG
jgi:hypothetical protein